VDQVKIVELPLKGRNFLQLGVLQPGVNPITPNLAKSGSGAAADEAYNVNGLRTQANVFMVDGTLNTDLFYTATVLTSRQVIEASHRFQQAGTMKEHAGELKDLLEENITHFHPGGPCRLSGRDRLVREFTEALSRSEDFIFEMIEPRVQVLSDNSAVLTYYISESWSEKSTRKNVTEKATEVWVRAPGRAWKLIHGHYSPNP